MNRVKWYRFLLVLILILLLAAFGFFLWRVYVCRSTPEDGTLVKVVEACHRA